MGIEFSPRVGFKQPGPGGSTIRHEFELTTGGVDLGWGRNRALSDLTSHFAPDVLTYEQNMLPSKWRDVPQ